MDIGIALDFHGTVAAPVTWQSLRSQACRAEDVGFDAVVVPDHLYYPSDNEPVGAWESVAMLGALCEATDVVRIGHSVINLPYRPPALVAMIATTLDEISGGRYVCGLGAGNTTDAEYEAFGFDSSPRFGRAAEAVEIIHSMLRAGHSNVEGDYHRSVGAEIVMRGPRPAGPPIVIAAHGPKMMRLAARFADEWNGYDHDATGDAVAPYESMLARLLDACSEVGRDPQDLRRSLDIVVRAGEAHEITGFEGPVTSVAEQILRLGELGIDEVRCYIASGSDPDGIASLEPLVEAVHRG